MKLVVAIAVLLAPAVSAFSQDAETYTVEVLNEPAPADIAGPIRAELNTAGLRVKDPGGILCDAWFRRTIPKEAEQGIGRSYPQLPDRALLGAIRVPGKMHDNRHNPIPPGIYVVRHGLQPQDGNHVGSADYIDFALFLNAKSDRSVDGGYASSMDMIQKSIADGGGSHPMVFALMPPQSSTQPSMVRNQRGHWVLETKIGDMVLAMVVVGVYEH
ncbi:MAG: hypothetical protein HY646_03095 [Acidobacteria bacterium]|nr:hypothetical protein [Acidobacteriota bacterium]